MRGEAKESRGSRESVEEEEAKKKESKRPSEGKCLRDRFSCFGGPSQIAKCKEASST